MLIGALAKATGVPAKTLRYWEAEGLLPAPARTDGGYRDYPVETADRVAFIRHAQSAGLTLRQIGEILAIRDDGHPPARTPPSSSTSASPTSRHACASSKKPATSSPSCANA
jgi:DNA-binding transcriptional MerR regulator